LNLLARARWRHLSVVETSDLEPLLRVDHLVLLAVFIVPVARDRTVGVANLDDPSLLVEEVFLDRAVVADLLAATDRKNCEERNEE
jgi:hypothetical protein